MGKKSSQRIGSPVQIRMLRTFVAAREPKKRKSRPEVCAGLAAAIVSIICCFLIWAAVCAPAPPGYFVCVTDMCPREYLPIKPQNPGS